MARLTSGIEERPGAAPIGEDRFLRWIDEMNEARAGRGINERYRPCRRDGQMTFEPFTEFKWKDRNRPSQRYATVSVVHWQDRETEPA